MAPLPRSTNSTDSTLCSLTVFRCSSSWQWCKYSYSYGLKVIAQSMEDNEGEVVDLV